MFAQLLSVVVCLAGQAGPLIIPAAEERFSGEVSKAEAELAKVRKVAGAARLKVYKDKLVQYTKAGDFDRATATKARIEELEAEPEGDPVKGVKKPRPKETVKFGGHVYALIKEQAPWHVARLRCEEMGGHLVIIDNQQEMEHIDRMCGTTNAWLGASNEDGANDWKWVDGVRLPPGTWVIDDYKTEPGTASALTHWYNRRFEDYPIGNRIPYICEWDK
ncbi:MAG: C-type lectin domain-containing protein [Planctomycetes bacterium]|nr:C-type lectin domain-containing protein [Planctomycetota bacterium]